MLTSKSQINRFTRFGYATLVAIYALIFIGGLVRATGSGMGCPDWPKCFGKLVPPTEESQLSSRYKEDFVAKRKAKNLRIASLMAKLGFPKVHDAIVADTEVYQAEEFNAVKTWIEYLNRLAGAIIGILILIVCVLAFPLRKLNRGILSLSILTLFLTFIQAFLGSIVVSTNLIPATITMHMLFTLVMVWALFKAIINVQYEPTADDFSLRGLALINMVLSLSQVLLGTQVREQVDKIKSNQDNVQDWLEALTSGSNALEFHRLLAFVVTIGSFHLLWKVHAIKASKMITFASFLASGAVIAAMITGIILAYFNMPAFAQPIHLTLGTMISGSYIWIFLAASSSKSNKISLQAV